MSKKEGLSTEPYKGVRDFYPEDSALLRYLFATYREVVERFGYVEYHASVLEPSELYKSKGAENEEMVNEQTYSFVDRGGREVTLRPEMTPTVARMVAAKRREMGFPLRLYSIPNLFRYERPQRGRLREHWQLNVDIFGTTSLAADAEIIKVAHSVMTALGASESDFVIRLGSRNFLDGVVKQFNLGDEQGKKLRGLLDRRAKMPAAEFERDIADLGIGLEMLSPDKAPADVAQVLELLSQMGVGNAVFDPGIIRGFDYYNGVVFEVFDTHPDNNRSIFGGGRYDGLTRLFDDEHIPAVGVACGDTAIANFLEVRGLLPAYIPATKLYIAIASRELVAQAMRLADELRERNIAVAVDFGDKKLGDQLKAASKHKIPYALVFGEDEIKSGRYPLRNLETGEEQRLSISDVAKAFSIS
jgi:histidyl-tRNA synthetase